MDAVSVPSIAPAAPATPAPAAGTPPVPEAGKPTDIKPGDTPAVKEAKRMLKAKIDGKEVDIDEAEAIAAYQKGKASDKRFEEAAKMKKQSEQFMRLLQQSKDNPKALEQILAHPSVGGDFRKIAEKYLYDIIQREQLSPEARENLTLKEELEAERAEKAETKRLQLEEQRDELNKHYTTEYQKDIIQTLEVSGLPKSAQTVGSMARYMLLGLQRGVELKAADVVDLVKQDYEAMTKSLYGGLDGEKLYGILGEDIVKKLRDHDLQKVRNGQGANATPPQAELGKSESNRDRKKMSREEFRNLVASRVAS